MPFCPNHPSTPLKPTKEGWTCEACDRIATTSSFTTGASLDLEALPFPVAYPLTWAHDEHQDPGIRLGNTIFAAYQAMRTTTLLLLADYLDVAEADRGVDEAIRGLRMPHWAEWTDLADKLQKFWEGRGARQSGRSSHFPALVAGWCAVALNKGNAELAPLLEGLPGLQHKEAQTINDALWRLRNDRAHRLGTMIPGRRDEQEALARALPLVDAMCRILFPPNAFTLLRRVSTEPLRAARMHGPHLSNPDFVDERVEPAWSAMFSTGGVAVLVGDTGLSVYPLFTPDDDVADGPKQWMPLIDAIKKKTLVLLGVERGIETKSHFDQLVDALKRKDVNLSFSRDDTKIWTLADWSREVARDEVATQRGRKYFPESYVERGGVDFYAAQALERGNKAVLLLGEAGSGKSSLLTRLVERLVAIEDNGQTTKKTTLEAYLASRGGGDVVIFLTGSQAYRDDATLPLTGSQLLCDLILRRAGIRAGEFRDLHDLFAKIHESTARDNLEQRRVWIVLDAINEADRFVDLVKAIDDVLPAMAKYPWLRITLSCRTGAYASLERRKNDMSRFGGVFANEQHFARFDDPLSKKDEPYLTLRPFDEKTEGPAAYRARAEALPNRACPLPWESLPGEVRSLLLNPLHLHVFHEAYAGRTTLGEDLDDSSLIGAYLDRLGAELEALNETLALIGQHLAEHHTPAVPADVVDGWLSAWRSQRGFSSVDQIAKLDPIEELVSASILMRPANEGFGVNRQLVAFTFSHQKLCEQVLVRELRRQIAPRTEIEAGDVARWVADAEAHPDFRELVGAMRTLLVTAARSGRGEVVASLLDLPQDQVRQRLLQGVIKGMAPSWSAAGTQASWLAIEARAASGEAQRERFWCDTNLDDDLQNLGFATIALSLAEARLKTTSDEADASAPELARRCDALMALADKLRVLGKSFSARDLADQAYKCAYRGLKLDEDNQELQHSASLAASSLGDVAVSEGRTDVAWRHFTMSQMVLRTLCWAEPGRADFLHDLAILSDKLGDLAASERRMNEARHLFEESLTFYSALSDTHPGSVEMMFNVGSSFERLGDLAVSEGRTDDARRYFEDCLAIRRRLSEEEPARADLDRALSVSLERLGVVALTEQHTEDARRYFEDGIAIRRRLSEAEPRRADFAHDLAVSFSNLGDVAIEEGRNKDAWRYFEDSLAILRRLSEAEPHRADLARGLSGALYRLGHHALNNGDTAAARWYLDEGLDIAQGLSDSEPRNVDRACELSAWYTKLGELAVSEGRTNDARRFFEDSLAIRRRLGEAEPGRADVTLDLKNSLYKLGELAVSEGRTNDARRYFEDGLAIDRPLSEAAPERADLARLVAAWLNALGGLAVSEGRIEEARGYFEENLAIDRRLTEAEPDNSNLAHDLSSSLYSLGELALSEGCTDDARRYFEENLAIRRRLAEAEPDDTDLARILASSLLQLGNIAVRDGRNGDAMRFFEENLSINGQLCELKPDDAGIARDLAVSFNKLGDLAVSERRTDDARRFFEDGLAVRRRLTEAEPDRADLARDFAVSLHKLAALAFSEGRIDEERHHARALAVSLDTLGDLSITEGRRKDAWSAYDDSLATLRRLSEAEPGRADLAHDLLAFIHKLAALAASEGRTEDARSYLEHVALRANVT